MTPIESFKILVQKVTTNARYVTDRDLIGNWCLRNDWIHGVDDSYLLIHKSYPEVCIIEQSMNLNDLCIELCCKRYELMEQVKL